METKFMVTCPTCKTNLEVEVPEEVVESIRDSVETDTNVRCGIKPSYKINVWHFNTNQIKQYLLAMAKYYVGSNTKLELIPMYTEKTSKYGGTRSYAALRIAFSEDIVDKKADTSFFASIGNESNLKIKQEIYVEMIKKFGYTKKEIEEWTSSYKILDELEEKFGITSNYLEELKIYANPKKAKISQSNENWIIFCARADKVIRSMIEDITLDKVNGDMRIVSVKSINTDKDNSLVEFCVHLYPESAKSDDNPLVRKLLEGSLDKKN